MENFHGFEESPKTELEEVASKICSPYLSATEADPNHMRKPAVDRIVRKIGEAPAELQEALLQRPEIIEAIVEYVTESPKTARTRLEKVPEKIKALVSADPRVQEMQKK